MFKKDTKYKLGYALSGGGTHGFAHLGAYQALKELGYEPDIISGTSVGSIAGALLCAGKDPMECLEVFSKKNLLRLMKPGFSKRGLMTFGDLEGELKRLLKIETFEELNIPLVITATDIDYGKSVHFTEGELVPRIFASCSIPVIFMPTVINGVQYVDGGVFMNLPVRPIRDICEKVIAVEINSVDSKEKAKSITHLAQRTFYLTVSSNTYEDRKLSDILISPENMSHFGLLDFKESKKIFEAGYNTVMDMKDIIRRTIQ